MSIDPAGEWKEAVEKSIVAPPRGEAETPTDKSWGARLIEFVRESNRIEGILRDPNPSEVGALVDFLRLERIDVEALRRLVFAFAPGAHLRDQPGMDVRVGNHFPIEGGRGVVVALADLLQRLDGMTPFRAHCEYETIHPFMDGNGRSGRALWLWMMNGDAPLGFLHTFYYQTLDARHGSNAD